MQYNDLPFFSIVIPAYNRAEFLPFAIESVLNQEFVNWELIIIDDGSTDNTRDIVAAYNDIRIKYFYQENQERSAARNNGIGKAKATYICFLDSDDYYLKNHLQVLYDCIHKKNSPVAFFYTGPLEKSGENMKKRAIYEDLNEHPVRFVFFNFLLMNSVCIHKDILKKHKFIEDQTILEDINLWIRILTEFPFIQIKEYTTVCVLHEDQSAKRFFKEADLKIIESYVKTINHIFEHSSADKYITEKEKKEFIKKRYISVCYTAAWASKYKSLFHLLRKTISLSPAFVFERSFYKILKEGAASIFKGVKAILITKGAKN